MSTNKRKHSETNEPSDIHLALLKFFKAHGFETSFQALIKDAQLDKNVNYKSAADIATFFPKHAAANGAAKNGATVPPAKKVKKEESSDSDSSDSDSDGDAKPVAKPAAKTLAPVAAAKVAAKKAESDSDSSSSSDSDSDEDEKPAKVSKPAAPVSQPTIAKKPTPAAAKKVESDSDSSSSSSSDDNSDDESVAKPVAKKAAPAPVAAKPAAAAATKKSAKPASDDESSSSSSSSSSDDEDAMDVEEEAPKSAAKKDKAPSSAAKATAHTPTSNGNGQEFKAYVKGLPWKVTDNEVQEHFKECPDLIKAEVPFGDDGRSTGTAYVSFSSRAGLDAALAMDGGYWPDTERWLKIVEASEKPERKSFGGATPGEKPEGCDTVFVGNLPWDVDEDTMRSIFSAAGEVSSVRFASNPEDGSFRGFGHVSFFNGDDVLEAVKLAGTDINGRAIRVDFAPPRARKEFGAGGDSGGRGRGRGRGDDGGRGRGRGRDSGRGGRGSSPSPGFAKKTGAAVPGAGKKITFD